MTQFRIVRNNQSESHPVAQTFNYVLRSQPLRRQDPECLGDSCGAAIRQDYFRSIAFGRVGLLDPSEYLRNRNSQSFANPKQHVDGRTLVIIAHRLATLDRCDVIVEMRDGVVVKIDHRKEFLELQKSKSMVMKSMVRLQAEQVHSLEDLM